MRIIQIVALGTLLTVAFSCKTPKVATGRPPRPEVPHNGELLSIQEVDGSGDTIPLKPNYRVVDPNSTLLVTLDNSALAGKLAGSELSPEITARLSKLKEMLQAEQQAIQNVTEAIQSYNKDPKSLDWSALMQKQHDFVRLIILDKDALKIYKSLLPANSSITVQYQTLFKTAAAIVDQIQAQVTQEAKTNGVYVQLGAWVGNGGSQTPVHIPGFDDYTPQPAYTVERFQYVLTDEQKNELNSIAALAQNANKSGLTAALKTTIKNDSSLLKALDSVPSVKVALKLKSQLETLLKTTDTAFNALKATAEDSYNAIKDFCDFITATTHSLKMTTDTSAQQLLLDINNDVGELSSKIQDLETTLKSNATTIASTANRAGDAAINQIKVIAGTFGSLTDSLKSDLASVGNNARDLLSVLLTGQHIAQASYDFTEKVKQLSIDQVPRQAVINLELAGKRSEGDLVTVKVATGKPNAPITEQALVQYHLYFCSLYARTATGFLFVNQAPIFKTTNNSAFFRYSASYSILLKGFWKGAEGSRTHLVYHTLWTPGLGVNFASLSFNPNGATELGIGGVFTILQDFVQIGYGVNTFSGKGYIFFGFRVPVGSFSFR
ncbi:MAG TPA: hypothetical protein VFE32_02710 [Puia sp.]|jgi:hypothetical protein|nr:hypothetical protein [Puia sp.]